MGPVAEEIKKEYDWWDSFNEDRENTPCSRDPFSMDHWYMDYLFPEMLIIYNSYVDHQFLTYKSTGGDCRHKVYRRNYCTLDNGKARVFPCWFISEEDVLRVMAEVGIM